MAKSVKQQNNTSSPSVADDIITCIYLAHTACYFSHNGIEYYLNNNETYQLPNTPFVQSLIGQGRLVKK